MTEKDLREIKRRFRPERSNIPNIVGCFVNMNGEIIAKFNQPMLSGESVVTEKLLTLMKKVLSGSFGRSLTEIEFSTKDVLEAPEHKLLMTLRESALKDSEALNGFYKKITESFKIDSNYVILLANDIYDVFSKGNEGEQTESSERFSYVVAAICSVKNSPESLCFKESDSQFHISPLSALISAPEIGFTFPLFDERKTNIYGALLYKRSISEPYGELCESLFGKKAPIPPKAQKEIFSEALAENLEGELSFELLRSVHNQFEEIVEKHRESHSPEPLTVTKVTVGEVLKNCGVADEKIEKLSASLDEAFGTGASLNPKNIVDISKFKISTPEVTVSVSPEHKDLVSTEIINGVKYILIRADSGVLLNGVAVNDKTDGE